jgi:hypothetical protein
VSVSEAARAARCVTSGDPRKFSHLGKRRGLPATIFSPKAQASARISARAENHLRDVEWRIGRLGAFVAAGQVDRSLVTERLGVAIELARLDEEPPR